MTFVFAGLLEFSQASTASKKVIRRIRRPGSVIVAEGPKTRGRAMYYRQPGQFSTGPELLPLAATVSSLDVDLRVLPCTPSPATPFLALATPAGKCPSPSGGSKNGICNYLPVYTRHLHTDSSTHLPLYLSVKCEWAGGTLTNRLRGTTYAVG